VINTSYKSKVQEFEAVEVLLHSFLTPPLLKVSDQNHTLIALPLEKEPTVPKIRRLGMPQSQFKHVEEGTNHLPPTRNESPAHNPVNMQTAIPAP
jgi:hypothetical protein